MAALFADGGADTVVAIDPQGYVEFASRKRTVRSQDPLVFGEWTRVKAGFDGKDLVLRVGESARQRAPAASLSRALINSGPWVGSNCGAERYVGRLARFRLADCWAEEGVDTATSSPGRR